MTKFIFRISEISQDRQTFVHFQRKKVYIYVYTLCYTIDLRYDGEDPLQKQPQEVFYDKNCSEKFRNIQRKAPVLESIFNKVAGLKVFKAFKTFVKPFEVPQRNMKINIYVNFLFFERLYF